MATIKSIEEKAKAYDEAIKRVEDIVGGKCPKPFVFTEGLFDYIFPELKESEDERMIQYFKDLAPFDKADELYEKYGFSHKDAIAWLEKQGKQKETLCDKCKKTQPSHSCQDIMALGRCALEKQGEQKPQGKTALEAINEEKVDNANKVEPKFKVGDWISGYYTNYKVLSVNNDGYLVEDVDGNKINILFENEKFHHLWTIQDAKDGDVLATKDNHICIFDNTVEEGKYPFAYCGLSIFGFEVYDRAMPFTHFDVYPATKEQRDLLFTKMEEAGYEWDARKKELNKVEQKEAIHKELTKFEKAVKQVMEEAIECGDTHNLKADAEMLLNLAHNSSWSEEDDIMKQNCHQMLALLRPNSSELIKDIIDNCHHWLKSIKDRVQPQSTWKPSDEQIKAVKEAACYSSVFSEKTIDNLISLSKQLKKLREEQL